MKSNLPKSKLKLNKFADPLPIPPLLQPVSKTRKSTYYEVTMRAFKQKLHRDLPPTRLWGYEGMFPGPTIEARRGELVRVKWSNQLPTKHFLPVDSSIHGVAHYPEVRTVVHLHGVNSRPDSDGYPEAWYTQDFTEVGPLFSREVYEYDNQLNAAAFWYHDHALGITRLNVYAGLAGFYLLRDQHEASLNLPKGKYEIPLMIQDRSFKPDGSLAYPETPDPQDKTLPKPSIVPGFCGETILVNGKVWPFLEVEPRKYRFRILNASNTRSYTLFLDNQMPITQIGTDSGFLRNPVSVSELTLAPAERVDIILDFSQHANEKIALKNSSPCGGEAPNPKTTAYVMQFRVSLPLADKDTSEIPRVLARQTAPNPLKAERTRNLTLSGSADHYGRPLLLLDNKSWMNRISETPGVGDTEVWQLINLTANMHPIHIHLIHFYVLERIPFDVDLYNRTGELVFTGPPRQPEPYERGPKDTVQATPGEVTRIVMQFGPHTGRYVWHCHILEHEDHDMMRPFEVR
ncbi:multicopper oxidase family protein [Brevibacillus fulvus]|uniref:Spore coat protein A n=1 Tax=Brevibacillus fulvus TaxID=1125967 RepID=A0A938Y108_9BACL|nr:multicopper oxidase [Brevibacillus fulvus]MBM7591371.1 spore coat protein A [Brevibacillus fulvus]